MGEATPNELMSKKRKWFEVWKKNEGGKSKTDNTRTCHHNAGQQSSSEEPCTLCKKERREQLKYRWRIILGLFLPLALSSLDVTIIASALPWIAADFNKINQMNWIISVFNLTSSAFIPFWGQMAELFGRHLSIQTCMALILIGSAFNTSAPSDAFPLLFLGRAIQGMGSAGMDIIIRAIVADKVSLEEDAKNWSIFSFVGGVSYAVGPVIGGYLTNTNWRWCFGINLPIGVAGMLIVFFFLRKDLVGPQPIPGIENTPGINGFALFKRRCRTIDFGGQALSILGFGLLILGFTWAGATYGWDSTAVLVPLTVGALTVGIFLAWQYFMTPGRALSRTFPLQQAMVPWEVITTKDIGLLFYLSFSSGVALFSVLYFCNLYFTMVKQYDSGEAGRQLLYFIPGIGVGVMIASFMCTKGPRQTWQPLCLGAVCEMVGIAMLTYALWTETDPLVYAMMALTGAGTGLRFMPVSLHAIAYFPERKASIISLVELSNPFGGTIGLTIMTTVFNNVAGVGDLLTGGDFSELDRITPGESHALTEDAKKGIVMAYISIFPFTIMCVIMSCLLGNVYIDKEIPTEGGEGNFIFRGVYLWALLRGQKPGRPSAATNTIEARE